MNKIFAKTALGLFLVLGLFLGAALFSFNLADGGWSSSYSENIQNIFGTLGAFSADFLLSVFGISAYLLPLGILYALVFKIYTDYANIETNKFTYSFIGLGLLLLVLSLSLLSGIFFAEKSTNLPYTSAGILGLNLAYFLRTSISTPIAAIIAIGLFLLGISNFLRFSWFALMDDLGAFVAKLVFGKKNSASASRFLGQSLDDDFADKSDADDYYEEEVEFDREAYFSQPLFDSDGKLVKDDQPKIDLRDAEDFLRAADLSEQKQEFEHKLKPEQKLQTEQRAQDEAHQQQIQEKNQPYAQKVNGALADTLSKGAHIGTFTTGVPLSSVNQLDLAKADIEAVKKIIDEAVGFEYEGLSAINNSHILPNANGKAKAENRNISISDEEILSQKLDKFDSEFRFDEKDDEVDFEFPDDFFASQEKELENQDDEHNQKYDTNSKLTTADADELLAQVGRGEIEALEERVLQSFSNLQAYNSNNQTDSSNDFADARQETPVAKDQVFEDRQEVFDDKQEVFEDRQERNSIEEYDYAGLNNAKGIDDLSVEKATGALELDEDDFSRDLAEEEDSSVDFEFGNRQEPKLDECYIADEIKYEPELEGAIMDRKTPPNYEDLSEDDKKAIKEPREFGYLNKSVPDADKMQNDADKLYRAIVQPREYGYIEEPVESLDKVQKDADNLYRAVSEPREYGYIEEPVSQLSKIQEIADKLYKAVSEPREHGYMDEPVEQLSKLQARIDQLYTAITQPREYGYLADTVPQIAQLQAYADELYTAISQPREHGFLEETIPQVQKLQDDIDKLYLAVSQPREYGYIDEPVESLTKVQQDTDEVINAVNFARGGNSGKKLDAVDDISTENNSTSFVAGQEFSGHLPQNVQGEERFEPKLDFKAEPAFDAQSQTESNHNEFSQNEFSQTETQNFSTPVAQAQIPQNYANNIEAPQTAEGAYAENAENSAAPSSDFFTRETQETETQARETQETDIQAREKAMALNADFAENFSENIVEKSQIEAQAPFDFSQFEQTSQQESEEIQEFLESSSIQNQQNELENQNTQAYQERQEQLEQSEQQIEKIEQKHREYDQEEQKVWRVSDFQIKQADIEGDLLGTGKLPSLEILDEREEEDETFSAEEQDELIFALKQGLEEFGVSCEVVEVLPGPVVTRFELELAAGVKSSKVSALDKDIARALKVPSVMVVEVTPGKSTVGVEIPNKHRSLISLRKQLSSKEFKECDYALPLALGEDISGASQVANLAKMPHLLVAGTTGSGKSVGINAMLLSLLYKCTAEELRLILIDPKMLELAVYQSIPHLLAPVVTDMKQAANALNWCVNEMEERYKLMAAMGVKNIEGYNRRLEQAQAQGAKVLNPLDEELYLEKMPFIVVVIDEFNDLMITVGKKVEELIARLAQKARASGIHLILATQRPSVDVITGLIKANIPARIGFQVSTKIDSRTILDTSGAEQLLGNGDSLYLSGSQPLPIRIHGAYVSDDEVYRVAEDWRRRGEPNYADGVLTGESRAKASANIDESYDEDQDELYDEVVGFVLESGRPSASAIQRRFSIGYPRAARLIDNMEANGLISAIQSNGKREILTR